ncbi:MAG: hypothetical protein BRD29_00510 [Bacteroidetes bacterium QH_2_67_10]|nr:MAG: hypothetical protein BRD29_00510 [Bacteroidetes bacterium QH_2_67_10]
MHRKEYFYHKGMTRRGPFTPFGARDDNSPHRFRFDSTGNSIPKALTLECFFDARSKQNHESRITHERPRLVTADHARPPRRTLAGGGPVDAGEAGNFVSGDAFGGSGLSAGHARGAGGVRRGRDAGGRLPLRRRSGRAQPLLVLAYGVALVTAGAGLICPLVSPLVAALALLTVALYLFVYTPLKRKTTLNTLVGTVPGALPALGGWAAATGTLGGGGGWVIFAVLACWQMPHFLALAWMYRKDYDRGGYAMVSNNDPSGQRTAGQAVFFCTLLLAASALPYVTGDAGWVYLAGALPLGGWFLAESLRFEGGGSVERDAYCTARSTSTTRA